MVDHDFHVSFFVTLSPASSHKTDPPYSLIVSETIALFHAYEPSLLSPFDLSEKNLGYLSKLNFLIVILVKINLHILIQYIVGQL